MTGGGQIAHQEIGDDRAEIEAHRSVEREFGIDHDGRAFRHHDRARVQVPMQQCLGLLRNSSFRRDTARLELGIAADLGGEVASSCGLVQRLRLCTPCRDR